MKTIVKWALASLIAISIPSCETEDFISSDKKYVSDIQIDKNHYYDEEIFSDQYIGIYGTWYLNSISGGFTGGGYDPDFDHLSIEEIGIFKIYRNDSLITYGKIEIGEQDEDKLFISFIQESVLGTLAFYDMQKYVTVTDGFLTLAAPCCDRYNYHFTNCECYSNSQLFQQNSQIEEVSIRQLIVPEGKKFIKVFFTDINNGYLLCSDHTVLKTEDGGESWIEREIDTELTLNSMWFQTKDTGFVVGGESSCGGTGCTVPGSILLKTEDGGSTWEEKNLPYSWSELHDIYFVTNDIGYAVGLGLKVKTIDGGENWTEFETDYEGIVKHVSFIDENTGYICGMKGNLFKTTDGGDSWNKLDVNTTNFLNTVCFADFSTGFLGQRGSMFKTADGGETWEELEYSPAGVYAMHFQNASKGIVFGFREYTGGNCDVWDTYMNITEDSGKSWNGDNRIKGHVNSASYPDEGKCYVLENYGDLFLVEY